MDKQVTMVRHAQSEANAGLASSCHANIPLTINGTKQAESLAASITDAPELFVVSPFLRAAQTAQPMIEKYPDVTVETWESIQEMHYLSEEKCAGTTAQQRLPMVKNYWELANPDYIDGKNAESFRQFFFRVTVFLQALEKRKEKNIVVVGHGLFMQAVICHILNGSKQQTHQSMVLYRNFSLMYPIENTGTIQLVRSKHKWYVSK